MTELTDLFQPCDLDRLLVDRLDEAIAKRDRLIAWFAAKYESKNPMCALTDPMTGQPLPANRELSDTWFDVVRHGTRCDACEGAGVEHYPTDQPGVFTLAWCANCKGFGFTKSTGQPEEQESSGNDPEPTTER